MLGRTHSLSGAALALTVLPVMPAAGVDLASPTTAVAFTIAAAGAAMLPDADHANASVAWSLPPFTRWLCRGVGAVFGGHRNGTHSLVGLASFVGFAIALEHLTPLLKLAGVQTSQAATIGQVAMSVWPAFLFAIATTALRIKPAGNKVLWTMACIAGGIGVAVAGITWPFDMTVIPWAVGIGVVAHIAGDMLTKEGCPLLWPWRNGGKWRLTLLPRTLTFTTDTWRERLIVGPLLAAAAVILVFVHLPEAWTAPVFDLLANSDDVLGRIKASIGRG